MWDVHVVMERATVAMWRGVIISVIGILLARVFLDHRVHKHLHFHLHLHLHHYPLFLWHLSDHSQTLLVLIWQIHMQISHHRLLTT